MLGYPRGSFEPLFSALAKAIEARGGQVRIDQPGGAAGARRRRRLPGAAGAPDSFRRGHDPRAFEAAGEPERYDARDRHGARRTFSSSCSTRRSRARRRRLLGRLRSTEYHAALCLLLEVDRRFSPSTGPTSPIPRLPFIGLIEQTNLVEPERYGGRRFMYVANYVAHDDRLLDALRSTS